MEIMRRVIARDAHVNQSAHATLAAADDEVDTGARANRCA